VKAVCLKCRTRLTAKTNGVIVEMGDALWKADLLQCPKCGFELVAGFGEGPFAEKFQQDYALKVARHKPIARIS
jgi:hypothetical protein